MIKERMSLMEVIDALEKRQLMLPLFQRPFVWSEEQVCDLFDSLWQGYPIGHIMLLEQAPPDLEKRLQCCFFHARTGSQHQEENLEQRRREAQIFEGPEVAGHHLVLDGQQRLFAFFIGIGGSYLRPAGPDQYESAQLYFDLYPLIDFFLCSRDGNGEGDLEGLRAEHHQFRFYSAAQLADYREEIQLEARTARRHELLECDGHSLQLPLAAVRSWGRDRRTAKSEIRRYLKPLSSLPKPLVDEFEDLLDTLHHHFWISEPVNNTMAVPRNSYDLLEIFSRLNQGSGFRAGDLHYAVRIVFPNFPDSGKHTFSRFLEHGPQDYAGADKSLGDKGRSDKGLSDKGQAEQGPNEKGEGEHARNEQEQTASGNRKPDGDTTKNNEVTEFGFGTQHYTAEELAELSAQDWNSQIFHELNPEKSRSAGNLAADRFDGQQSFDTRQLEDGYDLLSQTADELKCSLDFLYHCYLFCEAGEPEEIARNIRKREGVLGLRSSGGHLLRFVEVLESLRDAIDACNFTVRHWFPDNLDNDYVLLPVIYYFYRQVGECLDPLNDLQDVDLSRIVRWVALNEVAPSVFRGGVRRLAQLWSVLHSSMYNAENSEAEKGLFPLQRLQSDLLQAFGGKAGSEGGRERSLTLSDEDITRLLDNTKIKHRACIPLLALLYSHPQRISLMQRYEERQVDFIQPQKLLTRRMLNTYGLSAEKAELFFSKRDSVLNLQWLPKRLQTEKGDIPFRQWLSNSQQLQLLGEQNQFRKKELIINFMRFHHIKTEDGIYTLNAFERFLNERRTLLFRALKQYGQDFSDWDLRAKLTKISFAAF
ncbi:DUF262 domain-containing protein [Candidatus Haliotispira prima]|uniref:DUF262 domain-containing protein n=1 Tax=Candidatus Haliotispira prima TaxID=3034016 RepID=A0ABY8MGL7_9SPIO|nr:DUF262 domain-containing protein [Candidatus Haliotispira prima]